ncbi:MAG: hypothetical protein ABSB74_10500 [Tepidisphaeraceae bacterium]
MTQKQSDGGVPNDPAAKSPEQPPGNQPLEGVKPKKKKRHWLLKAVGALLVLIIILVILAPTIISMGFVREIVVGQINSSALNGKLQIKDWSFGWISGIRIEGVQLTDADNKHLVSVAQISTPLSLLKAATGNIDLGDVTVSGVDVNAIIDRDGNLNILQAIKPSNKPPSNQPTKLPNIKGVIHLKQITGTFEDDPDKVTVGLDPQNPLTATIAIKDINQPIEDTVDLGLQLQEKNLVKVKVSGTLSAIQNNLVAVDHLAANQTIELADGDLAAVSDVLQAYHLNLTVTGKMNGKITATVNTLDHITADVGIALADLSAGGKQLAGDTVAFQALQFGLKVSVDSTGGKNAAIKLDMPITAQPNGSTQADQITVHADVAQDSLLETADVFKAIAAHLTGGKNATAQTVAIAGSGQVKISADLNVANLVSQAPHFIHLEQGTSLSGGRLTHETTLTLADGKAVIATETHLKDFSGTNGGHPVQLSNIDLAAGVTAVGGDEPDLRNIKLSLSSAFANIQGGGETLGKTSFQGTSDLKNLQQQVNQIVDLDSMLQVPAGSHATFGGTIAFHAHTDGDLTAADSKVAVGADFSATDVDINIPGRRQMSQPKFTATIGGNLHHTAAQFVQAVHDLAISIQSPAINFQAAGEAKIGGKFGVSVPTFAISQGTIDLRLVQEEFGGAMSLFVPGPKPGVQPNLIQRLADNSDRIESGSVTISGKGEFDQGGFGFSEPLKIQVQPTDLAVTDDLGTEQTVHIPAILDVVSGSGSVNDQSIATVKDLTETITIGPSENPLFTAEVSADAMVAIANPDSPTGTAKLPGGGSIAASRIELSKCQGDLAALQSAFGPLMPLVLPQPPAASATSQPSIMQLVAQNLLLCTSGKLTASMTGSYDGTTFTISKPLTVSIADLSVEQKGGGGKPIENQTIAAAIGGSVSLSGGAIHANLQTLSLQIGDQLKIEGDPQSPLDVALTPAGKIAASGSVQLAQADLPKLLNTASLILPPEQMASLKQLTGGQVSGTFRLQPSADATTASADLSVNALTVGQILNNETIHLVAGATLASDFSAVHDASLVLETSFAKKISVTNGQIVLLTREGNVLVPTGLFNKVQSLDIEVDDLDLAKVDGMANLLQPPPPGPGEKTVVVYVPPAQITGGTATLKVNVSRQGDATTANVSQALVHGLALKTGQQSYAWPSDITAQLSAEVDTLPDATSQMPLMAQVAQMSVTALSADLGLTKIALAGGKPIVASGLGNQATMLVQGGISVDGDIEPAARLAEVFSAAAPNAYPYKGHYHFDESLAKDPAHPRLHVLGGGAITQFQAFNTPPPVKGQPAPGPQLAFSEDKIAIHNGFDFDFGTYSVIIDRANPISVSLESTKALAVQITGTVNDLPLRRQIPDDDRVQIQANYDLAKLWSIVKPLLSPSQQQSLADLTVTGQQKRTFTISGSYPADKPFNQAIAMINVGGYLTVDSLSTQGITIQNLDVPLYMTGGVLKTVYPDQPNGQNAPKPATCNDGTLDIGVLTVDLRTDPMVVSMDADPSQPHYVLRDVSINPAMAKSFLGKILNNPAFANAKESRGLVSVWVLQLQKVPLSGLVLQSSPQNQGIVEVQYSVRQLQIGSELLAVFGNSSVSAEINNADVKIQNGRATEDTTLMIDQDKPLRFAGVVILATEQFAPMTAYIPPALFDRLIPANVRQYVPDQVIVPLKGDMNHPKLELDQAIAQTIQKGAKKAVINGLLQGLGGLGRRH